LQLIIVVHPIHKWLPIGNSLASIKINLTDLGLGNDDLTEFSLSNEFLEANSNAIKRIIILNSKPFMNRSTLEDKTL